jgi:hypothetical protein
MVINEEKFYEKMKIWQVKFIKRQL